jgi:hypothetical protein
VALPRFGLNRFDARTVDAFAVDVRRAETLGWDVAFQPDSQLMARVAREILPPVRAALGAGGR